MDFRVVTRGGRWLLFCVLSFRGDISYESGDVGTWESMALLVRFSYFSNIFEIEYKRKETHIWSFMF